MKGKSVTFRPRADLAARLDKLSKAAERSKTWIIEKCVEGHLPEIEKRYQVYGDALVGNSLALAGDAGGTKARTEYLIKPAAHRLNEPRKRK